MNRHMRELQSENGKAHVPTDVLIELSKFYGTSVDYLLDFKDEKEPHARCSIKQKRPKKQSH